MGLHQGLEYEMIVAACFRANLNMKYVQEKLLCYSNKYRSSPLNQCKRTIWRHYKVLLITAFIHSTCYQHRIACIDDTDMEKHFFAMF